MNADNELGKELISRPSASESDSNNEQISDTGRPLLQQTQIIPMFENISEKNETLFEEKTRTIMPSDEQKLQTVDPPLKPQTESTPTFEEKVEIISSLEKKISEFRSEMNSQVERIHDQLNTGIQIINTEATVKYNAVNKDANDAIVILQQQIEQIMQKASIQQHEIYENTCLQTQQAKEAAYIRVQEINNARSTEIQLMMEEVKKQKLAIGLPVDDLLSTDVPSSEGGTAGPRDEFIARGMAMYQIPRNQCVDIADNSSSTGIIPDSNIVKKTSLALTDKLISVPDERVLEKIEPPLLCEFDGCMKRPSCNVPGQSHGRFCGAHKLNGMINVIIKRCETSGCNKMPGFNFEGETERRFCAGCKLEGMVNIAGSNNQMSSIASDSTHAKHSISLPQSKPMDISDAEEYSNHNVQVNKRFQTEDSSENSSAKRPRQKAKGKGGRCEAEGCKKHPSFNEKGLIGGRFCSAHKIDGMVDVISKRCEDCSKQAAFNYEGQTRGRFCSKHKVAGMINVKDKLCEMAGCSKYPTANFEGQSGRRFCTTHKMDGMINFTNKRCEAAGCVKHPKFNFAGKSGRRFCGTHKLEGMVSIS